MNTSDELFGSSTQRLEEIYTSAELPPSLTWQDLRVRLVQTTVVDQKVTPLRWIRMQPRRASWHLVTAAALMLALLGAGFAGPLASWFGGRTSTAFAYAAINQSVQISNGITLTAVKGYVDPKHLVLYYDVQLSSDLSGKYVGGFVEKSTMQNKKVDNVCAEFGPLKGNNPVFHCALVFPAGGDIAGDTFKVTWDISEMEFWPPDPHPTTTGPTSVRFPAPTPTFIQGDWTFQLSLPFRHEVQDPLLISFPGEAPIPIPTSLPR